jgi:hypothetical protein
MDPIMDALAEFFRIELFLVAHAVLLLFPHHPCWLWSLIGVLPPPKAPPQPHAYQSDP